MAKKRGERQSGLTVSDSTVKSMVQAAQAKQQAAQEGDGRGKPGHAGQKGVDKRGHEKVTYYIPVERQNLIREMAKAEEVTQSNMIELAVIALYNAWQAGKIDLDDLKIPKKSLHVMWELVIPDEFDLFSE